MVHLQSPTPAATDITASDNIVNRTAKQKISRAIDIIFYWFRDGIRQNNFHIFWEDGKKTLADYVTRHHQIWHHITMRPRYFKSTKNDIENSKDR